MNTLDMAAAPRSTRSRGDAIHKVLIAAGIGGMLPTLCRLAATYSVSDPTPPAPAVGLYIALALFFFIGMAVAFGFGESDLRKAFTLGIAAPAIVTSIFNAAIEARENAEANANHTASITSPAGPLGRLFGISDAYAQQPLPRSAPSQATPVGAPAQLTISTNLVGTGAGFSSAPVELRFMSETGEVLGSTAFNPKLTSSIALPPQARFVQSTIDGKTTTIALPADTVISAQLNLNIETARTSDFLWALGSNRRSSVKSISGSIENVVRPRQPIAARPASVDESVKAGTRLYSRSGVAVGVVESVKRGGAGKPDQIVVRGTDVKDEGA